MIRLARDAGKRVLVDPKGDDYARYAGASAITPNRAELREVVGRWRSDDELTSQSEALRLANSGWRRFWSRAARRDDPVPRSQRVPRTGPRTRGLTSPAPATR